MGVAGERIWTPYTFIHLVSGDTVFVEIVTQSQREGRILLGGLFPHGPRGVLLGGGGVDWCREPACQDNKRTSLWGKKDNIPQVSHPTPSTTKTHGNPHARSCRQPQTPVAHYKKVEAFVVRETRGNVQEQRQQASVRTHLHT